MTANKTSRKEFLKSTGATVLGLSVLGLGACAPLRAKKHPNFIIILADDLGWVDTSVAMSALRSDSRHPIHQTVNLERLVGQGMTFSQAYAASPVCSPTRDSVLTGKTPTRLHHSILLGKMDFDENSLTLPKVVKAANRNYITAHFGKWGCTPNEPEDAGYDISDGDTDNWHGDWRYVDGAKTTLPVEDPKRIFSVTKRARKFMQDQVAANKPFLMQISHYAAHVHHYALPATVQKYQDLGLDKPAAIYAAMIEDMDTGIGSILDEISQLGIEKDTYVIFTSDNGGDFWNGPLRGGKASLWEGGIRVPTIISGPGIAAGSRCDAPMVQWDLLPTIKALAGDTSPLEASFDGGDIRPLLFGETDAKVKRGTEDLIFHYPWFDSLPMSVIIRGDYKLVKDINTGETRLFNLVDDIGENVDLTEQRPALAEDMKNTMGKYLQDVKAEDIEDLRRGREADLIGWGERDRKIEIRLKQEITVTQDQTKRDSLDAKLEMVQRLIRNHDAALGRVAKGRLRRAW